MSEESEKDTNEKITSKGKNKVIITINREYGSGGRFVGKIIADKLGIPFYDKELINEISKESGLSKKYIEENEQKKHSLGSSIYNNEDALFIAEAKAIKKLASKSSCVIVGRCANYILSGKKNVYKVFLYSSLDNEIKRAVKYYGLSKDKAEKQIKKINKQREKHYKYYTEHNWRDFSNYDICLNVDEIGVENTSNIIIDMINKR